MLSLYNKLVFHIYTTLNGIYQNGIVFEKEIPWHKIHSWEVETDNRITFLLYSGIAKTMDFDATPQEVTAILSKCCPNKKSE